LNCDLVPILSHFEREGPGEVERAFDIFLVDFQVVVGEYFQLIANEVRPWHRELDLAAWNDDVRVALDSFARHCGLENICIFEVGVAVYGWVGEEEMLGMRGWKAKGDV